MPPIQLNILRQRAVLWPFYANDSNGLTLLDAPVEIRVRAVTSEGRVADPRSEAQSDGQTTVVVDRRIEVGSILWIGKKIDLPPTDDRLRKVVKYDETPDFRNRHVMRTVVTERYGGTLPEVVGT